MRREQKLSHYMNASKSLDFSKYDKKIRIAILGSFTLKGLDETLEVKCSEINVGCDTYASGYNQYNQESKK